MAIKGAPVYVTTTNGIATASTISRTRLSMIYLWHTAANTKRIEILRIALSDGAGTSTSITTAHCDWAINFITAENATPGGTLQTAEQLDPGDPASSLTGANGAIRVQAAAPTRNAADLYFMAIGNITLTGSDQHTLFDMTISGKPIVLRAGVNEGLEINSVSPATTNNVAHQGALTIWWREI